MKWWKRLLGYKVCPVCRSEVRFRCYQLDIYHPEEPPMFYRVECPVCEASALVESPLTTKTAKELGYNSGMDLIAKAMEREEPPMPVRPRSRRSENQDDQ